MVCYAQQCVVMHGGVGGVLCTAVCGDARWCAWCVVHSSVW